MGAERRTAERLEQLRRGIEQWRRRRTKHGPMPEALWHEAALLARSRGTCPVSRALGIGYEALQERVARVREVRTAVAPSASTVRFVELSGAEVAGQTAAGVVVELHGPDGVHLTVRLPHGAALDVAALVAAFRARA